MLKWRRNKCGGSHPEGLDRIDSTAPATSRRTQSMKLSHQAPSSPPRGINRKKNEMFTRSYSEILDKKLPERFNNSYSEGETTCQKRRNLRSLMLENINSPVVNSPFENVNLEDIYKGFAKASHSAPSSAPSSPLADDDVYIVSTPTKPFPRQSSGGSLRQTSPTGLPCIEEAAVENDELASIADSGICDDEYDHTKHYFEPLKFHDDENDKISHDDSNNTNNNTGLLSSINQELTRRLSPPPQQNVTYSETHLPACGLKRQNNIEHELTSSQESDSSLDNISFDSPSSPLSDIDNKNNQIFSRLKLKADLDSPSMTRKLRNTEQEKVPHSLISSMLWKGNTSNQPPSSTGIYSTVPPNRYGQRNKDLMSQLTNSSLPERKSSPSPKEFKVSLDVSHYGPDEILVTLEDGKLVVNGKHFSESEYGFESLQFHRRYPIPEGIKKADITSTITDDGVLIITGRVGTPEPKLISDIDRLSDYDNVSSPRLQRVVSSGRTTPELLSSGEHKIVSPSLSRRSLNTSDYSEDSRSRLSDDSRSRSSSISENEFRETEDDTFMLKVNCKGYDPQDLEIKIQSRELIVHGRQKICSVENGHERIRHKEFTKRYSVPRNANCHQIMSKFTEDEQLVVEIKKSGTIKRGIVRENILDDE